MKLTLAEPKYLKESVNIISELVNEARFKIHKDAVELVAMDPANVAMVIFKLLSSAFVEYDVKESVTLAINLSNLKAIMRRTKPGDVLTLQMKNSKLGIILKGVTTRTFSLPILDLEDKEQKIPDLKFNAVVSTDSSILTDAIEDADVVGESVCFAVGKDSFIIDAQGDLSQASIVITEGNEAKIKCLADSKSKYSIEYLKKMIQAAKLADKVDINLSTDYPLRLDYKTVDKVMLSFILAPRVEND